MTEQQAIESTYFDRAAVYRRTSVKDEISKQTKQTDRLIIDALPCALSRDKSGALALGGGYGQTSGSYTLFCSPDAGICAGDKLVVTTAAGQVFTLWAGAPFAYPQSHCEIPATTEERA